MRIKTREVVSQSNSQLIYKNYDQSGHEGFITEAGFWHKIEQVTKRLEKVQP